MADDKNRCWWCGDDPLYVDYHDAEWGVPTADDRRLFEKLCLEGFQAGLSWLTILRKREGFRRAFAGFEIDAVAAFDDEDVERLVVDPEIVRHCGKIRSAINNARRARELVAEEGSLAAFIWRFEPAPDERPDAFDKKSLAKVTQSRASFALSRALKKRGFTFVGPTTAYAFMQAVGMVNDHVESCFRRADIERAREVFRRP